MPTKKSRESSTSGKPWKVSSECSITEVNNENVDNRSHQRDAKKYMAPKPKSNSVNVNIQVTSISNSRYDDNWANKQIAGFTEWMNFIFSTSSPDIINEDELSLNSDCESECMKNLMDKVR
jgi:hypothetical protein